MKCVEGNSVIQYWKRYEYTNAGSYTIFIPEETTASIILVGGGGGGAGAHFSYWDDIHWGGCGGICSGKGTISAGTYTLVVGGGGRASTVIPDSGQATRAGGGGNTSVFGQIAYGGGGAYANANYGYNGWNGGSGYVSTSISGFSGVKGMPASYNNYKGYGRGGYGSNTPGYGQNGSGGYARIDVLSNESDYTYTKVIRTEKVSKDDNDVYYGIEQ